MTADLILQKFNSALVIGCNFAAIRLPESGNVYFFYATRNAAMRRVQFQEQNQPVFFYSPYSASNKAYTLVSDAVFKNDECIFGELPEPTAARTTWFKGLDENNFFADDTFYTNYVNNIIASIEADKLDKVVAARCENLPLKKLDAAQLFTEACNKYPDACVYFFSTEESGTWFGASPEKLISVHNNQMDTIALAGTLPANEEEQWTDKEYDEQGMISFFIENILSNYNLKKITASEVEQLIAGNIKHLCTKYNIKTTAEFLTTKFHKVLGELNPTPAVCGLPQFEASLFIAENEKMERRFYSGFIGIQQTNGDLETYVNLRCCELFEQSALLYAGAGITLESDAQREWHETQRKLNTMKSILTTA